MVIENLLTDEGEPGCCRECRKSRISLSSGHICNTNPKLYRSLCSQVSVNVLNMKLLKRGLTLQNKFLTHGTIYSAQYLCAPALCTKPLC